ncbi:hypothetical protein B0H11DRAFT_2044033 [Mycena galericulata]|nr:hypothetical protein B0H11DRAFT_2044033 [Mycena galericulata]
MRELNFQIDVLRRGLASTPEEGWRKSYDILHEDAADSRMWSPFGYAHDQITHSTADISDLHLLLQPSIFDVSPSPSQSARPISMSFRFASSQPSILDSIVMGPKSQAYFFVATDAPAVGFTVVHNSANQPMIVIEWSREPIVEVRDIIRKQRSSRWLALSKDKRYRTMSAKGRAYIWAPEGECICLYASGLEGPQVYAKVFREEGAVTLELAAEAVQMGLLEVCVAATLLLQCGRNIDEKTERTHSAL